MYEFIESININKTCAKKTSVLLVIVTVVFIILIVVNIGFFYRIGFIVDVSCIDNVIAMRVIYVEFIILVAETMLNDLYQTVIDERLQEISEELVVNRESLFPSLNKKAVLCFGILYILYFILMLYMFIKFYFKFFSISGIFIYLILNILICYIYHNFVILNKRSFLIVIRVIFVILLLSTLFITARYLIHPIGEEEKNIKLQII